MSKPAIARGITNAKSNRALIVFAWSAAMSVALALLLSSAAQSAPKTWNAGVNNTWDTATTANWTGNTWATGDDATFGVAGVGAVNIVGGGSTARTITFNTAGYTIGGGDVTLNTGSIAQIVANQDATIDSNISHTAGAAGYMLIHPAAGKTLSINGDINSTAAGKILYFQLTGNIIFNGSIGSGFGTVTGNSGATTVTFAAPNSFTGTLHAASGNTIIFSDVNQLGTGTGSNFIAIQNGSTLRYTGTGSQATANRDFYANAGNGTVDITSATGNLKLNPTNGTVTNGISGTGTFFKTGTGTLTLATAGVNYQLNKPISISGGTLALQANGTNNLQVQSTMTGASGTQIKVLAGTGTVRNDSLTANWSANLADMDIAVGGTFDLRGNRTTVDALSGGGSIINSYYQDESGIRGYTLTVGVDNGSGAFSGTITGTGTTLTQPGQIALVKVGAGTQTLSGGSTYSGGTTINAGTLNIANATGSATGSGNVTVGANGTLGGTGSIVGAAVDLFGTVSPGSSVGILSANSFNWQGGGTYDWEVSNFNSMPGVGWDLLDLTDGALSFVGPGPFNVDIDASAVSLALPGDYLFEIARADSIANFSVSSFNLTNNGPDQTTWSITQIGNRVYLQAHVAPEPSTLVLFAIGGLLCVFGGRRVIVPRK